MKKISIITAILTASIIISSIMLVSKATTFVFDRMTVYDLAEKAAKQYGDQEYDSPQLDPMKNGDYSVWLKPKSRSGSLDFHFTKRNGSWELVKASRNARPVALRSSN